MQVGTRYTIKTTGAFVGTRWEDPETGGQEAFDFALDPLLVLEAAQAGEDFRDSKGRVYPGQHFIEILMAVKHWTYGELHDQQMVVGL